MGDFFIPEKRLGERVAGNKLTVKQKKFIEFYLATGHATEAAIKAGYSDNHVTLVREPNIAYNDDEGIEKLFNKFCEDHKGDNISLLGTKLQGAKVIHNHPDDGNIYGDCFSLADFSAFFKYKIKRLEVISGLGHYSMVYKGPPVSVKQVAKFYQLANEETLMEAAITNIPRDYEQEKIMYKLNKIFPGFCVRKEDV